MQKNDYQKLLRCPFCGSEAKYDNSEGYHYVICDECGARNFGFSKERAFDEWNSRVQCVDEEINYLEKQDSSNELLDFVKFCRNASATNIRQIHDRARDLIAKHKQSCEKSCKEENATFEPLVPKWQENEALAWLIVDFSQYNFLCFEFRKTPKILSFSAENKVDYKFHQEEIGTFNTIEEAKQKVNECIRELGERLVYFAENIRIEE